MSSGTCTYMMRCTLPWVISRGATPKAMTRPAARATAASQPSVFTIASALQDHVEGQDAHDEVDGVGGREQLEPVRDGAQRLAEQQRLGRLHRRQQHGHLH